MKVHAYARLRIERKECSVLYSGSKTRRTSWPMEIIASNETNFPEKCLMNF